MDLSAFKRPVDSEAFPLDFKRPVDSEAFPLDFFDRPPPALFCRWYPCLLPPALTGCATDPAQLPESIQRKLMPVRLSVHRSCSSPHAFPGL
eukprot:1328296-Amorphochlora_amoeboformis.AAC.3